MKVKDLIKILEDKNQDDEVFIATSRYFTDNYTQELKSECIESDEGKGLVFCGEGGYWK